MTKNSAPEAIASQQPQSLAEHTLIRTTEVVKADGVTVPEGTVGTIVFVHEKDDAFEVEFDAPFEAVVSLFAHQVEAARASDRT